MRDLADIHKCLNLHAVSPIVLTGSVFPFPTQQTFFFSPSGYRGEASEGVEIILPKPMAFGGKTRCPSYPILYTKEHSTCYQIGKGGQGIYEDQLGKKKLKTEFEGPGKPQLPPTLESLKSYSVTRTLKIYLIFRLAPMSLFTLYRNLMPHVLLLWTPALP